MDKLNDKNPSQYREDAMTGYVCLVCGEYVGKCDFFFRGKPVCRGCIEYIRSNY